VDAVFNKNDHAILAGYATYMKRLPRMAILCRLLGGHKWPEPPAVPNGHRPDNFARCGRCKAAGHWFALGQHRYGGYDKDVFEAIKGDKRP
jgi:hypothetical protein